MLVGKQDGVNHGVGALSRLDGALQGLLAASVVSVGQNNERLAALLLLHQFIRGEEDGVVKQSAGAPCASGAGHYRAKTEGRRIEGQKTTAGALKLRSIEQL